MVLRQPLTQRRRHPQQLLTITLDEVLSHTQKCLNPGGQARGLRNSLPRKQASSAQGLRRTRSGSPLTSSAVKAQSRGSGRVACRLPVLIAQRRTLKAMVALSKALQKTFTT